MRSKSVPLEGKSPAVHPFRAAILRGLAVVLPPLLTIVIFLWIAGTVQQYVLTPVATGTQHLLAWSIADIRSEHEIPAAQRGQLAPVVDGVRYHRLDNRTYIPQYVYDMVMANQDESPPPKTGKAFYHRYVLLRYLNPYLVVPFFLSIFILMLYLLGKFMAAGAGRVFWNLFERGVHRVPLVRNVYGSVKQVSDFLLSERQIEYSRVVAVQWPRKGIWTLGLVTGESLADIEMAAGEPVLSVLICTSPMPMTGFTVSVRKSEVVDLNITIDQAIQYIVSCGVVVPARPGPLIPAAIPSQWSITNEFDGREPDEQPVAGS